MNPIVRTVFSPDPSAHVWDDKDTLWVYTSNDTPKSDNNDSMYSYHVFSTKNMIDWFDYGCVLNIDNVKWAASNMFAIDAAFKNNLYYLIFCAIEKESDEFRVGVATSKNPQGPFIDRGYIQGTSLAMDPAVFTDDDGKTYLYWAGKKGLWGAELTDDMMAVKPETMVYLSSQIPHFYEGPFLHKYNNKYYVTYPGIENGKYPQFMNYAIADHPLGPFEYRGKYIPNFEGQAGNNHGSVVEFKGKWYAFHHSKWVSNWETNRNMMCDYLNYDKNGDIIPITPTKQGVSSTDDPNNFNSKTTVVLDASQAPIMKGKHVNINTSTSLSGYTGDGYVEGFTKNFSSLTVMAQAGITYKAVLKIRYMAPNGNAKKKIHINGINYTYPEIYPCYPVPYFEFEQCNEWRIAQIGEVILQPGENHIRIYGTKDDIKIDCIFLTES